MARVAIVLNTSWNIVNFRRGLILALQEAGHDVVAIAPEDEFVPQITATGCAFVPLTQLSRKGTNPLQDFKLMHELRRIFQQERIDITLNYTIKPNIYGSIAARRVGIPSINTITGIGYVYKSKKVVRSIAFSLYRYALRHSGLVAFQNPDDKKLYTETFKIVDKKRCTIVPGSGINTSFFTPVPPRTKTPFTFLFIGRLLYDKGVPELIEAARILKAKYPEVEIQLVGGFDKENPAMVDETLVQQAQNEGVINYLGRSNNVREILQEAHAVVLPSHREGVPRSLLEALAMAKPVVTTDAPGCRETVIHGENGFLVPLQDAKALAEGMEKILCSSEEERQKMGEKGRALALNRFDEQIIVKHYVEGVRRLLAAKK